MGGERASTTRQRESGKICCNCHVPLPPPPAGHKPGFRTGERFCPRCTPRPHAVTMRFEKVFDAWRVSLSAGGRALRSFTFADRYKVEEMAERGGAFETLADRQGVEYALGHAPWLGMCELRLTDEQMAAVSR